jgi:lipopolysaccharide biosynthesis glycosyltransferase
MNAISLISIGRDDYLKYCLPSVEKYCEKFNVNLELIQTKKWNFQKKGNYNFINFEKNQTYDLFDKYDKVLRVDSDVIFTPSCPDLFKLDSDFIYGVREDVDSRKPARLQQIKISQKSLGSIDGWNEVYLNSGIILCSSKHKEMYNISKHLNQIKNVELGPYKEQTFLNWKINSLGHKVKCLDYRYNHMSMFEQDIKDSFIIHYAGEQGPKAGNMSRDYKFFYG